MPLRVELVMPDRRVWSGEASMVIAKTLDGDIGVLIGHPPVLGVLAEGSIVRVLDPRPDTATDSPGGGEDGRAGGPGEVVAAVSGGFLSVADDQVTILAAEGRLSGEVNTAAVRESLEEALSAAGAERGSAESPDVKYARALLRAAGE